MVEPRSESREAIAERMKLLRKAFGLTKTQFGEMLGLTQQAVSNYESGIRRINVDDALKVARGTRVTLDWIYRGDRDSLRIDVAQRLDRAAERPSDPDGSERQRA